jgi:hypothetical protein
VANPLAALIIARAVVPERMPERRARGEAGGAEERAAGGSDPRPVRRPLRALRARRSAAS